MSYGTKFSDLGKIAVYQRVYRDPWAPWVTPVARWLVRYPDYALGQFGRNLEIKMFKNWNDCWEYIDLVIKHNRKLTGIYNGTNLKS